MTLKPILFSFSYALSYLREQVSDVPDEKMTFQPAGVHNHPAWTIGHLAVISQAIGEVIGIEPWLDGEWVRRHGPGSTPTGDAGAYPSKAELTGILRDAEYRVTRAVSALEDPVLDDPFPDTSFKDVFPSVRQALVQVLVGHASFHVGQISVWRRAAGLGPMARSFE